MNDYNRRLIEEFRASGGKVGGMWEGTPLLLLTTRGAKSGERRTTPMGYMPDGDRLIYSVYFRGEEESQWKLLKSNTHDNAITFDGDVLADGKYFFRVMASDREANPPPSARNPAGDGIPGSPPHRRPADR